VIELGTLREILRRLETLAPREFTLHGFESRVEVGHQTEHEQIKTTVKRVLVATYPSRRVVTKASQMKANLLVTHRPLFPWAIDRVTGADLVRLRLLTKNYTSTYVMGSPWIAARDGLSDALVEALGLTRVRDFTVVGDFSQSVPIGRVCTTSKDMNHSGFANYVAAKLSIENMVFTGDLDAQVEEVFVVAGSILDMPEILEAKKQGAKTIVTGELAPDIRLLAREEDLNVLELGAFVTEEPGMRRLCNYLRLELEGENYTIEFEETRPVTRVLRPYK